METQLGTPQAKKRETISRKCTTNLILLFIIYFRQVQPYSRESEIRLQPDTKPINSNLTNVSIQLTFVKSSYLFFQRM